MLAFVSEQAQARRRHCGHHRTAAADAKARRTCREPIATALKIDDLKIELGYALLPLVNLARRNRSPDRADQGVCGRQLAGEMGL